MTFVLICFLVLGVVLCWVFHIRVDFKTFFRKGFRATRSVWGTYAFCGFQGGGKSLSITKFCIDKKDEIFVFSNIAMTGLPNYEYFSSFDEIYSFLDRVDNNEFEGLQVVIVFDEIFTQMTKSSKLNSQIMGFLAQLRKRRLMFLTTCQSWAELPLSFRRLCRYEIDCSIFAHRILVNCYKDAERMKWDEIQMDFVAPIVWTKISKLNTHYSSHYDTRQLINNKYT